MSGLLQPNEVVLKLMSGLITSAIRKSCILTTTTGPSVNRFLWLLQEAYIADLDAKSGASLKLTLLNPRGRIWTMVAGGGASVVYRYSHQSQCLNLSHASSPQHAKRCY